LIVTAPAMPARVVPRILVQDKSDVSGMKAKTHTASDDLRPGVHAVGDAGGDEDDGAIILVRTAVVEQAPERVVVAGSSTHDNVSG